MFGPFAAHSPFYKTAVTKTDKPGVKECAGRLETVNPPGFFLSNESSVRPYKPVQRLRIRNFNKQTPFFWSSDGLVLSLRAFVSSISASLSKFSKEIVVSTNLQTSAILNFIGSPRWFFSWWAQISVLFTGNEDQTVHERDWLISCQKKRLALFKI